jgi:hypothetical protein
MSQSFTISSVKAIKYNELQQHAGLDGLVFIKGYPTPKKNRWPKGHTLVYRNRVSVRPIDIHFDGHTFAVKIFAASSPEDYAVAISLIQAIISMGGGKVTPENSHEMGLATFKIHYNPAWVKNHSLKSFRNLIETFHDSKVPIKMTGVKADIELGPRMVEHLLRKESTMAVSFFERFRILNYMAEENVYQASLLSLKSKNHGIAVSLAEFKEGLPTVFNISTDLIGLKSTTNNTKGQITLEKMIEVLGNDALWLSENVLLAPGYKGRQWSKFFEKASPFFVFGLFESETIETKDGEETLEYNNGHYSRMFSEEEWSDIIYAPLLVFGVVANSDGMIEANEIKEFTQLLVHEPAFDSDLMREIMLDLQVDLNVLLKNVLQNKMDVAATLKHVTDLVDKRVKVDEALAFKFSLMSIGVRIAEISGGLFGFEDSVSTNEQHTLTSLMTILKIPM